MVYNTIINECHLPTLDSGKIEMPFVSDVY